ncbi:MAG: RNA methyltransferase [Nitrospinae bacterium]|nr:RNA methyltransferase [Nitrospinota bacterium]
MSDTDKPDKALAENLAVALVHYPVLNKPGDEVVSSVTTLDVHDFARVCRTYGVSNLYIITPVKAQQRLVERLSRHWIEGFGAGYNPHRKEALECLKVVDTIDDMIDNFKLSGDGVELITTAARKAAGTVGYQEARQRMAKMERAALLFGTGHGLAPSVMERSALRLSPVEGADEFNHLPVRCAAAIILDRLLGRWR